MRESERVGWLSPSLGEEMRLLRYGTAGAMLVYVPSSGGDETEFARYGMPGVAEPWIRMGRVQVVSVDGAAPRTLWNERLRAQERIARYAAFERYVAEELLSWLETVVEAGPVTFVGSSYGAFVAANLLLKHPGRVHRACGLGGVYGLWHRLDGYHDDDVYFHTPLEYLPRLEDPEILSAVRGTGGLDVYAAADDEWLPSSLRMAHVMREKQLPHSLRIWPAPAGHHERWWREQLLDFLTRRFPALGC